MQMFAEVNTYFVKCPACVPLTGRFMDAGRSSRRVLGVSVSSGKSLRYKGAVAQYAN